MALGSHGLPGQRAIKRLAALGPDLPYEQLSAGIRPPRPPTRRKLKTLDHAADRLAGGFLQASVDLMQVMPCLGHTTLIDFGLTPRSHRCIEIWANLAGMLACGEAKP